MTIAAKSSILRVSTLAVRIALGLWFVRSGLEKAFHPEDFLKIVHQYGILAHPPWLNLTAAVLPWLETCCGLLLVAGVAVRGSALVILVLLVAFTGLVFHQALGLHAASGGTFCAVRFDCGCGGGEVFICRKLVENVLLAAMAAWLTMLPSQGRTKLSCASMGSCCW